MPELAPVIAATLSLKFFIDPPADGWLRAQVRAVADSDSTAYLLISKWRVLLRTANVKPRSEEHTSELQSLMRISYAVFCLKNRKYRLTIHPQAILADIRDMNRAYRISQA